MKASRDGHRRRWPWAVAGTLLVLIDLFFVIVLIELATGSTRTDGRAGGIGITCVLLALLSWLAFLSFRAMSRRGRAAPVPVGPLGPPTLPGPSRGRRVGGAVLAIVGYGIAALIAVVEIVDLTQGDSGAVGGALTGAAVCAALGTLGVNLIRTPSATANAQLLQAYGAVPTDTPHGPADRAPYEPMARAPSWLDVPVDRSVSRRESMSELPRTLVLGTLAVIAAVIVWGVLGGPPGGAAGVLFAILIGAAVIAVIVIAIFLPFGIRLRGGVLTVGALGVPRIGRGWRRQDIPLEEVIAWTVCRRTHPRTEIPRSPFPDGDVPITPLGKRIANWGNLTGPGVRHTLIVRVDPARVPAVMPVVVMMGYGVEPTARSTRDIGVYVIGTHRPRRWTETLEKAMPSRRSLT